MFDLPKIADNEAEFCDWRERFEEKYGKFFTGTYFKMVMDKMLERVCYPHWVEELPSKWTNNPSEVSQGLTNGSKKVTMQN